MEKQGPNSLASSEGSELRSLGEGSTQYLREYAPGVLEAFEDKCPVNPHGGEWKSVVLNCPEFTSLCPKTGQPDFGEIVITYVPAGLMVESKSLKLYLGSFRNHGSFHETVVTMIGQDLVKLLRPRRLKVVGNFKPRGGISIVPTFEYIRVNSE
jgi:7-cyano-7-deazaguanine reductase